MSDNIAQVVEHSIEEDKPKPDPLQETPPPIASEPAVDRTMLARTILRPSPDVQGTSMEGETVLLNLSTGRYYTLNRLGSVIWEHCTGPAPSATFMRFCATVLRSHPSEPWTISSPWSTNWSRRGYFNRKGGEEVE